MITGEAINADVRLPVEIRRQIEAKAATLNLDFQSVVAVLLKLGLRAQEDWEQQLQRVTEALQSATDPEE